MQSNTAAQISTIAAKPILKWAGGKTQMLGELLPKVPSSGVPYSSKWAFDHLFHMLIRQDQHHCEDYVVTA